MIEIICLTLIPLSCAVSCVYGIYTVRRGKRPSYFNIALVGVFALLLSRIYTLLLYMADGSIWGFSLGILGQICAYMFFAIANRTYIPLEYEEKKDRRVSAPALLAALLPCACFVLTAVINRSVDYYIVEALYSLFLGFSMYCAVKNIINRYNNPFKKELAKYNILLSILIMMIALFELFSSLVFGTAFSIVAVVVAVILSVIILMMLPALRKGLSPWEI